MIKTFCLENWYMPTYLDNKRCKIIDKEILKKLNGSKNKINIERYNKYWDKTKKYSNIYELIYIPNKTNRKHSISNYRPLSRSYFKLWEIIQDFKLLRSPQKITVLCLAEGPGGFMESIIHHIYPN